MPCCTAPQLQGKTDELFVRSALQLFREHLGIKVVLSPSQVLEQVGG